MTRITRIKISHAKIAKAVKGVWGGKNQEAGGLESEPPRMARRTRITVVWIVTIISKAIGWKVIRGGGCDFGDSDFRLKFFPGTHGLLLHFDQGFLKAFPLSSTRSVAG